MLSAELTSHFHRGAFHLTLAGDQALGISQVVFISRYPLRHLLADRRARSETLVAVTAVFRVAPRNGASPCVRLASKRPPSWYPSELVDNAKFLLRVYWQPGAAMSAILDQGSLLFASLAVLAVSVLLAPPMRYAWPWLSFSFYTPLLVLAVVYVPGILLLGKLLAQIGGGAGTAFERDYSPLLICTAMAWTAANLPLALAGWIFPPSVIAVLAGLAYLYFVVLMFFVVRTVFGIGTGTAVTIVCLSWIPLVAALIFWRPLQFLLGWVASPFFLFYAYYYLSGELGNLGAGLRSRQNFHRMLEAAAVNPHDGEAQYQLGLIYQQRHQYAEAIQRFKNAVAIDPAETGAHFQLGRIAREQGRLEDALGHFQTVLDQDERHNQSEILRELGAVYIAARQYGDALNELAGYADRWPYDPEGLFYYGLALEGLGRPGEASEMYERAIEAARASRRYRRHIAAKWSRLAQKQIRKLGQMKK
jgi:tetratricopeptide (TPR) repeat protein